MIIVELHETPKPRNGALAMIEESARHLARLTGWDECRCERRVATAFHPRTKVMMVEQSVVDHLDGVRLDAHAGALFDSLKAQFLHDLECRGLLDCPQLQHVEVKTYLRRA